jgi:phage FluMu gp28-like protein
MNLLPYQKQWFSTKKRKCIIAKSRQIGLTETEAYWSIIKRLDRRQNHYFISQKQDSSNEFIKSCIRFLEKMELIDDCIITSEKIIMPNKSEIVALSSNPDNIRGKKECDVTLDEFAFHEQQKELYMAAEPATTWNSGQLRIISTFNGIANEFYRLYQEAHTKPSWFSMKVDIYDAVRDGIAELIYKSNNDYDRLKLNKEEMNRLFIDEKKNEVSSYAWKQEYECMPASSGDTIITDYIYNKIATINNVPNYLSKDIKYGKLYIGIDPGRKGAYSVIWVLEEYFVEGKKKYRTVCIREMTEMRLPEQMEITKEICSHPSVHYIACDMGAQGRSISEMLKMEHGNGAEEVAITSEKKAFLCENLRKLAEKELIEIPKDEIIRNDLMSMRTVMTENKNCRYESVGEGFGHGDYFMALGLAVIKIQPERKPFVCLGT